MTTFTDRGELDSEFIDSSQALVVFSSDSHVGPPPSAFRPYCPKKYLKDFDEFASAAAVMAADREAMYENDFFADEYRNGRRLNLQTAGHWDPHARLRDMDRDGVSGAVIFHESL